MPTVSKAQFKFMQGVKHGTIKKPGLSQSQAAEFVSGQSPKGLPDHIRATQRHKRFSKISLKKK